jgi:ABC-type multidrug transport system permease subunit
MGLSFLLFGVISLNLLYLLRANIESILTHGIMILREGALQQLLELIGYSYVSLALYLLFKTCENILVTRFTRRE